MEIAKQLKACTTVPKDLSWLLSRSSAVLHSSQPPVTPAPMPSSRLQGHFHSHAHTHKETHIFFKLDIFKRKEKYMGFLYVQSSTYFFICLFIPIQNLKPDLR